MLDQKVAESLTLQHAAKACESPDDLVYLEHIPTGYRWSRFRREAEFMIELYPDQYRMADGPDNIDDETQPWWIFDDNGELIDISGSLDDPEEELTPEDRERILAYRASTTEAERKTHRATSFARRKRHPNRN